MLLNCGVGEDSWESLGLWEIQPVHSKGDQPWDFFGGNDAEAKTPVLWPPHAKNWLIGKDFDAGRDWGKEEKGTTEDEMAGWHRWLNGCESEWTPVVGYGQGGLACCNSWGYKELDTTEWLNWTVLNWIWCYKHSVLLIWSSVQEAHNFILIVNVCLLSSFSHVQLFVTPWTVVCLAPLSMRLSRQEYWSGLPCSLHGIFWPRDWSYLSCVSCIWQADSPP